MHYHDRRLIKSVPKTLKVAISSLASKHSEARKDKAACETKCETVQETKRMIEQSLQDQFTKVRDACLRVKSNCRGFNVAEELCMFVSFLKNDTSSLRSTSVIKKAMKFVEKLEMLADELQDDDLMVSIIEPSSSATMSPPLSTKRKTHSKPPSKAPQPAMTTTVVEDLISINPSPTNSLMAQVDRLLSGPVNTMTITSEHTSLEDEEQRKRRTAGVGLRDSFRRTHPIQQQSPPSTSDSTSQRKYAEYTTERLIALSRESADECKSIAKELNRRCGGTSIGYLSPPQLLTLCEYYASSRLLQSEDLIRIHSQLLSDVQQLTDHDPFEILSVPTDKLLYLAAITLCLQNASKYQ